MGRTFQPKTLSGPPDAYIAELFSQLEFLRTSKDAGAGQIATPGAIVPALGAADVDKDIERLGYAVG